MKDHLTETVDAILDDIDQHKVRGLYAWAETACSLSRQLQHFKIEEKHYNSHFLDQCMEERAQIIIRTRFLLENFQEVVNSSVESVMARFVMPELPGPLYSNEFNGLFRKAKALMVAAQDLAVQQSFLDQRVTTVKELLWACKSPRWSVRLHMGGSQLAEGWLPSLEECKISARDLQLQFRGYIDAAEAIKQEVTQKSEAFESQYDMWGSTQAEVCFGARAELQRVLDSIAKTQEAYKASPEIGVMRTCRDRFYSPLL